MAKDEQGVKVVATNRRARRDFTVDETFEAGLVLQGTEVKSLRDGNCSLTEAYARPSGDELFLYDMHIPPYEAGVTKGHEPTRPRKLLLHRRELDRIISQCNQRGYTVIPLRLYFKSGRAKVQIGLARRRRAWDKRQKLESRQRREEAERELGRRRR